jgi:competence protein ComEC
MGGMPAILSDLHPRELWVGIDPDSRLYRALIADAARLQIPVRHLHAGDHQSWGSVQLEVLAPARSYSNPAAPKNDDSVVLHMQFGKASALLEGDAERPSEDTMVNAGLITPVTLLKVGHHGSKTSSNPEFLAAAQPREAVISVGRQNTFGHPRAEVIQRFAEAHTRLFRTDEFGLTTFLLSADGRVQASVADTPVN